MDARLNVSSLRWQGLSLALVLSFAFMGGCIGWVVHGLGKVLLSYRVTESLNFNAIAGTPLPRQLAAFSGVLIACHVAFGFLIFLLARLTAAALHTDGVRQIRWLVLGWFVVLTCLLMAANATWFPSSIFAWSFADSESGHFGLKPVAFALIATALVAAYLTWRAAMHQPYAARQTAAIVALALAAAGVGYGLPNLLRPSVAAADASRPNIVLLGIDSLRADLTIPRRGKATAPNVEAFLKESRRFGDAISPLARTYPSWMSILTGRHPVSTNARFNLMPRRLVHEGDTLAGALRAAGYHTAYATDEVRYANFDESFGFEQLITPPIGAVDFILGFSGDMPVVNLIASTGPGKWLFPTNHANRAANVTYQPQHFLDRLASELHTDGPSFLAIHLTLAHWPYAWAGKRVPKSPPEYRVAYDEAVAAVDMQFQQVLDLLSARGVLDNAVVVLLSDHGEALGANNDSMLRGTGSDIEIWDTLWGHGTSVLSPNQYRVLLAMRPFGRGRLPGEAREYAWPVSLEDLRPTLEALATGRTAQNVDGISLLPFLADPSRSKLLEGRIRFTETDFNTPSTQAGHYEVSGIVDEAAGYYEVDPDSGWVQFRAGQLPELIRRKQRAAVSESSLLAFVPDQRHGGSQYLYTSRQDAHPRRLTGRPDERADPEAARLWDALQERFRGELPPPG